MQKQIDAEVKDEKIVKDATIEWGAMGPGGGAPPPEETPPEPPAPEPSDDEEPQEEQLNEALNLNITEIIKNVRNA